MGLLADQGDLVAFASAFALVVCAAHCVVLKREEAPERRWMSYFSLYLWQALAAFWAVVTPLLPPRLPASFVELVLQLLSFGSLFAFASAPTTGRKRRMRVLVVVLILTAGIVVVGLAFGVALASAVSSLVLALPGVAFGVRFLMSDPAARGHGRLWLVSHAASLAALGIVTLGAAAEGMLSPGIAGQGFLLARSIVSVALAASLSGHAWRSFDRANRGFGLPLTRLAIYGAYVFLPVLLVLGGLAAMQLGNRAAADRRELVETDTGAVLAAIMSLTGEIDRFAEVMAGSPLLSPFLTRPNGSTRAAAEEVLDRFAARLHLDCYLLDVRNTTVAASREAPAVPEGSYIQDAAGGATGREFAKVPITQAPRYCASAPVWDAIEGIVGVAVVMAAVDPPFSQLRGGEDGFVVDDRGVVFLTSRPDLVGRRLWPEAAEAGVVSGAWQAAGAPFGPLLAARPAAGAGILWEGAPSTISRAFLYIPGWSVVLVGSLGVVRLYRIAALLATTIVLLVVTMFSAAGQISLLSGTRVERSESRYRALVEGSPDWISIVDSTGAFRFTNRAGWRGAGREDALPPGGGLQDLLAPADVAQIASRVGQTAGGGIVSFETTLTATAGGPRMWRITLVPLPPEGGVAAAILMGSDVTEMRRAEARLLRAERHAALGTLAAGVAHQFYNINAVALGYVQVLETDKRLSEDARKYLGSVRAALDRAVDITSRLLPLSVAPGAEESRSLLGDAVRSAIPSVQEDLAREAVTLDLALDDAARVPIGGQQLGFIVGALLVNAWHAVMGQPIRRILVETGTLEGQAFLRVQDTGIGIAPERLSSLFTPFFSQKGEHAPPDSPQARVRGVGLSLAVSHSIVTGRGGRIEAESSPGAGSTFTVWLPAE
jgi:PAS domain S-box-containing protein